MRELEEQLRNSIPKPVVTIEVINDYPRVKVNDVIVEHFVEDFGLLTSYDDNLASANSWAKMLIKALGMEGGGDV